MPKKRAFVVAALVALLFAAGTVSAADRDVSLRQSARSDLKAQAAVKPAGPASVTQILHQRFRNTVKMLREMNLNLTGTGTITYSTAGLSDGPDPIDVDHGTPGTNGPSLVSDDQNDGMLSPPDGVSLNPTMSFDLD